MKRDRPSHGVFIVQSTDRAQLYGMYDELIVGSGSLMNHDHCFLFSMFY